MSQTTRTHLFSAVLASLLQERDINQVKLNKLTGIAVSRVNNYLHGNYRTIKPAHVAAIARPIRIGITATAASDAEAVSTPC